MSTEGSAEGTPAVEQTWNKQEVIAVNERERRTRKSGRRAALSRKAPVRALPKFKFLNRERRFESSRGRKDAGSGLSREAVSLKSTRFPELWAEPRVGGGAQAACQQRCRSRPRYALGGPLGFNPDQRVGRVLAV